MDLANITTVKEIITNPTFAPYVNKRIEQLNTFFNSGIIVRNNEFDRLASEPAPFHIMPFFEDLEGDSENVVEEEELTPTKLKTASDMAGTIRRAKMWATTDLAGGVAGVDPDKIIAEKIAGFWAHNMQKELINMLDGVFSCETMKDTHVHDISNESAVKNNSFNVKTFLDACQKLGDQQGNLRGIAMHSATYTYLKQQDLVSTIKNSTNLDIETYQGRSIVIDDGCPVESGVYTTYLFGPGAVAYGVGTPARHIEYETDRAKKMGSGINYLISRKAFILHPRGVAFTNSTPENIGTLSREELKTATNWKRVYNTKDVRMIAFKHKLG